MNKKIKAVAMFDEDVDEIKIKYLQYQHFYYQKE